MGSRRKFTCRFREAKWSDKNQEVSIGDRTSQLRETG